MSLLHRGCGKSITIGWKPARNVSKRDRVRAGCRLGFAASVCCKEYSHVESNRMMGQRCFSSYESNFSLKDEQRVVSWCLSIVPAVDCCLKHRCPGLHQCSVEDSPRRQAMNQGQWVRGEFFTVLEFDGGCFRRSVNS